MGILNLSSLVNKSPFLSKTKSFVSSLDSVASKDSDIRPKYVYPNDMDRQAEANYMIIYVYDLEKNDLVFKPMQQQIAQSKISKDLLNKLTGVVSIDLDKDLKAKLNKYKTQALDYLKDALKGSFGKDWGFDLGFETPEWIKSAGDNVEYAFKYVKDLVGSIDLPSIPNIGNLPDIIDIKINKQKLTELKNLLIDKKNSNKFIDNDIKEGWKLATSIALPLPINAIEYETKNGIEGASTKTSAIVDKIMTSLFSGDLAGGIEKAYDSIKGQLPEIITNFAGEGAQAIYQSKTNEIRDPLLAIVHSVPDFRTFKYDYIFAPRTSKELFDVYNIIRTLRFYSLPGKVRSATSEIKYLAMPAYFKIKYYTQGQENAWLGKTKMLGLSDVKSSIDGDVSFIKNDFDNVSGNAPRIITLSLSFMELAILTRDDVNEGY